MYATRGYRAVTHLQKGCLEAVAGGYRASLVQNFLRVHNRSVTSRAYIHFRVSVMPCLHFTINEQETCGWEPHWQNVEKRHGCRRFQICDVLPIGKTRS